MTEPLYIFVKDKGWTPTTEYFVEFTFECGTRCKLVDRRPLEGERYRVAYRKTRGMFGSDGKPNLEYWASVITSEHYDWCSTWKDNDPIHTYQEDNYHTVTVVPL